MMTRHRIFTGLILAGLASSVVAAIVLNYG
jgi:hypothetical protein